MAEIHFPRKEDEDVKKALSSNIRTKLFNLLGLRPNTDQKLGAKLCSDYDASDKRYGVKTSVRICKEGNRINFQIPVPKLRNSKE